MATGRIPARSSGAVCFPPDLQSAGAKVGGVGADPLGMVEAVCEGEPVEQGRAVTGCSCVWAEEGLLFSYGS